MVHGVPYRYKGKMSQVEGALSPISAVVQAEALAPVVTPFAPPLPPKQSSASNSFSSFSSSSFLLFGGRARHAWRAYERALDREGVEEEKEPFLRRRGHAYAAP